MLFWVGPRESDIDDTENIFDGSITLFGEEKGDKSSAFCNNYHSRVNHNIIDEDQDNFTVSEILDRLKKDADAKFLFYNPNIVYKIQKLNGLRNHILCLNDENLMEKLNNKISFRELFAGHVNMLDCKIIKSTECDYRKLREMFSSSEAGAQFIIQAPVASGGYGTFLLNEGNNYFIKKEMKGSCDYLVSQYLENAVSVNGHLVIFENDILRTPCSVQIMRESNHRLFYRGADFITYRDIPAAQRKQFEDMIYEVGKELQKMGYRGICGIDGIITEDKIYILEINNRFQASTPLINLSLSKIGMPSLHMLNLWAFENKNLPQDFLSIVPNIDISYSYYFFTAGSVDFHYKHLFQLFQNENAKKYVERVALDGYDPAKASEKDAYQYKVVFHTNITGIDGNNQLSIYSNITEPDENFYKKIEKKQVLFLKVALLNQGIRITGKAEEYLRKKGGIRPGTNSSVDIMMEDIVINCPVNTKFSEYSPFSVDINREKTCLYYYGSLLKEIKINPVDIYSIKRTKTGVSFGSVANMSSDRLRVHHTASCIFKICGQGCKFCDIMMGEEHICQEDVHEVIDFYLENTEFVHFLVGGQSESAEKEYGHIIDTVQYIRARSDKKIYIMCLPPEDVKVIERIYEAGATEIAFNIEIFDRSFAQAVMPGKGKIPLKQYMDALEYAVGLFGKKGEVRSLLLAGLEKDEIFFEGVESLARKHIQPILSAFRPLPDTEMCDAIQPSNERLIYLYQEAEKICSRYGMHLGPDCIHCQNNTLSVPWG